MSRILAFPMIAVLAMAASPAPAQEAAPPEQAVSVAAPPPFPGDAMFLAFHGQAGIDRIVDDLVARSLADRRVAAALDGADLARLRASLKTQFCYILGGGCPFAPADAGLAGRPQALASVDFGALVENLQAAMTREGVPPRVQNRLIARLAPVQR